MKVPKEPTLDLASYPGGLLVAKGISDIQSGRESQEALLVSLASPSLRDVGLPIDVIPAAAVPHEHALYNAIEARCPEGAHAEYNALIAKVVSFANAYSSTARNSRAQASAFLGLLEGTAEDTENR